jgi:hypothetical protein
MIKIAKSAVDTIQAIRFRLSGGVVVSAEDYSSAEEFRSKLLETPREKMVAYRSSPNTPEFDRIWSAWVHSELGE